MNIKIPFVLLWTIVLAWCGHVSQNMISDEVFDANHDAEMEKSMDTEWMDDLSATIDLYTSNNDVKVVESKITLDDQYAAYYFAPDVNESAPGIVIVHEWWGLNDNIKDMWRVLASEGYQVVAVDMYNGNVATTPDEARELVGSVNQVTNDAIMLAAEQYLRDMNAKKVASLGRCFGGAQSLSHSLASDTLDATVIYYGRVQTDPTLLANINAPILWVFGAEDASIPVDVVNQFETALMNLGKNVSISIYDGAGHAFANPTGQNFNQEATVDAWEKTLNFLKTNLQ